MHSIIKRPRYSYDIQEIEWQEIPIEIRYCPDWSVDERGFGFAHLEIVSVDRVKLPITETGYRSHFIAPDEIEVHGDATEYALAWLDEASRGKAWIDHLECQRQGCLF